MEQKSRVLPSAAQSVDQQAPPTNKSSSRQAAHHQNQLTNNLNSRDLSPPLLTPSQTSASNQLLHLQNNSGKHQGQEGVQGSFLVQNKSAAKNVYNQPIFQFSPTKNGNHFGTPPLHQIKSSRGGLHQSKTNREMIPPVQHFRGSRMGEEQMSSHEKSPFCDLLLDSPPTKTFPSGLPPHNSQVDKQNDSKSVPQNSAQFYQAAQTQDDTFNNIQKGVSQGIVTNLPLQSNKQLPQHLQLHQNSKLHLYNSSALEQQMMQQESDVPLTIEKQLSGSDKRLGRRVRIHSMTTEPKQQLLLSRSPQPLPVLDKLIIQRTPQQRVLDSSNKNELINTPKSTHGIPNQNVIASYDDHMTHEEDETIMQGSIIRSEDPSLLLNKQKGKQMQAEEHIEQENPNRSFTEGKTKHNGPQKQVDMALSHEWYQTQKANDQRITQNHSNSENCAQIIDKQVQNDKRGNESRIEGDGSLTEEDESHMLKMASLVKPPGQLSISGTMSAVSQLEDPCQLQNLDSSFLNQSFNFSTQNELLRSQERHESQTVTKNRPSTPCDRNLKYAHKSNQSASTPKVAKSQYTNREQQLTTNFTEYRTQKHHNTHLHQTDHPEVKRTSKNQKAPNKTQKAESKTCARLNSTSLKKQKGVGHHTLHMHTSCSLDVDNQSLQLESQQKQMPLNSHRTQQSVDLGPKSQLFQIDQTQDQKGAGGRTPVIKSRHKPARGTKGGRAGGPQPLIIQVASQNEQISKNGEDRSAKTTPHHHGGSICLTERAATNKNRNMARDGTKNKKALLAGDSSTTSAATPNICQQTEEAECGGEKEIISQTVSQNQQRSEEDDKNHRSIRSKSSSQNSGVNQGKNQRNSNVGTKTTTTISVSEEEESGALTSTSQKERGKSNDRQEKLGGCLKSKKNNSSKTQIVFGGRSSRGVAGENTHHQQRITNNQTSFRDTREDDQLATDNEISGSRQNVACHLRNERGRGGTRDQQLHLHQQMHSTTHRHQQLPSNSSIPPLSDRGVDEEKSFSRQTDEADMGMEDEEDENCLEYTSMWADISQHTLGKGNTNIGGNETNATTGQGAGGQNSFVLGTTFGGQTTLLDHGECTEDQYQDVEDDLYNSSDYYRIFHTTGQLCASNLGTADLNNSFYGSMSQASAFGGVDTESSFQKDEEQTQQNNFGGNQPVNNANNTNVNTNSSQHQTHQVQVQQNSSQVNSTSSANQQQLKQLKLQQSVTTSSQTNKLPPTVSNINSNSTQNIVTTADQSHNKQSSKVSQDAEQVSVSSSSASIHSSAALQKSNLHQFVHKVSSYSFLDTHQANQTISTKGIQNLQKDPQMRDLRMHSDNYHQLEMTNFQSKNRGVIAPTTHLQPAAQSSSTTTTLTNNNNNDEQSNNVASVSASASCSQPQTNMINQLQNANQSINFGRVNVNSTSTSQSGTNQNPSGADKFQERQVSQSVQPISSRKGPQVVQKSAMNQLSPKNNPLSGTPSPSPSISFQRQQTADMHKQSAMPSDSLIHNQQKQKQQQSESSTTSSLFVSASNSENGQQNFFKNATTSSPFIVGQATINGNTNSSCQSSLSQHPPQNFIRTSQAAFIAQQSIQNMPIIQPASFFHTAQISDNILPSQGQQSDNGGSSSGIGSQSINHHSQQQIQFNLEQSKPFIPQTMAPSNPSWPPSAQSTFATFPPTHLMSSSQQSSSFTPTTIMPQSQLHTNLDYQSTVAAIGNSNQHPQNPKPSLDFLEEQLVQLIKWHSERQISPFQKSQFEACIAQIRSMGDLSQRSIAQMTLLQQMQHLSQVDDNHQRKGIGGTLSDSTAKNKSNQLSAKGSAGHQAASISAAYTHHQQRDYSSSSSASKISSSSHHSSVSSQHRSQHHQSTLKIALSQAFRELENCQTDQDRRQLLILKSFFFARDKNGIELLKRMIDEDVYQTRQQKTGAPSQFVEDLLHQLLFQDSALHKLMMHQVANFFCQTLFKQASKTQIEQVLAVLRPDFSRIAIDPHGTRALQALLEEECIKRNKKTARTSYLLYEALKGGRIFEMSCNIRANHVLQQCLALMDQAEHRAIILEPILRHFSQVSKDKNGCQVVQQSIMVSDSQYREMLIDCTAKHLKQLINDEFGNFVIQTILQVYTTSPLTSGSSQSKLNLTQHGTSSGMVQQNNTLQNQSQPLNPSLVPFYEYLIENLGQLCKQQYSSHVVEKAVATMPRDYLDRMLLVFLDKRNSTKKHKLFKELMFDSYGNYVVPKMIEFAKLLQLNRQFDFFVKVFNESADGLKKVKHGRQLITKINQILGVNQKNNNKSGGGASAKEKATIGNQQECCTAPPQTQQAQLLSKPSDCNS